MFSEVLEKISWEDTTKSINAKTDADVRRALGKQHLDVEDFKALISPAAAPYLEQMAQLSKKYTEERFGKTISMFIPLYLTNSCANGCIYCGFNSANKFPRTILNEEEMVREYEAIKKLSPFDTLLMVTGENPAKAGTPYLARALDLARPYFANLQIEVMPLSTEDYAELVSNHGLNGVTCFQETYHRDRYKIYHPRGMKSNFEWRVNGFDRMGMARVNRIGMGVLIGLEDWRTDVTMMAYHLRYLEKTYWKSQYSVNFPRMRPSESGFQPNVVMSDREMLQAICAMRIFDRDVDISISTREAPDFRDNICTLGVTTMSAESATEPGGYACYPQALEQFEISDNRKAVDVVASLKKHGRQPVFKNWEFFNKY